MSIIFKIKAKHILNKKSKIYLPINKQATQQEEKGILPPHKYKKQWQTFLILLIKPPFYLKSIKKVKAEKQEQKESKEQGIKPLKRIKST